MESQPQNPEFRINPENFHPCTKHSKHSTPALCICAPKYIVSALSFPNFFTPH